MILSSEKDFRVIHGRMVRPVGVVVCDFICPLFGKW